VVPSSCADDPVIGGVLSTLLLGSHLMAPGTLVDQVAEAARPIGVTTARIYLADLQQHRLRPMPDGSGHDAAPLAIDSTPAGRAFQTIEMQEAGVGTPGGGRCLWIPLVEGVERLGVLELCFDAPLDEAGAEGGALDEATVERSRILASLVGLLIASKGTYSDVYTGLQRSRTMALQAEMVWAFMAPRTFATRQVLFAAALEPAYEVGGDAFDHSLIGDRLHVSLFDSVGHDLTSGLISSVAMASCRTVRRSGGDLTDIARRADQAIAAEFGASRFATALLCDLDVDTGEFSWLPCGHPPPLLIRGDATVEELLRRPCLPLGLHELVTDRPGSRHEEQAVSPYTEHLRPGDRILLYTDGVVEGRDRNGRPFDLARLSDFIVRHTAEGLSAPELLRRLNRDILEHQNGRLTDDATLILLEWMPDQLGRRLTL
jgi:Stage II sporulation protein E (SpoIIE)